MALRLENVGDGRLEKMEVDYSATVDQKIPLCEQMTKQGRLTEALDILISLEKQARTASDAHSTSKILVAIVKLCFEAKNWQVLNESIVLLSKRRGQVKQAVTSMIQEACKYVEEAPSLEEKLKYINTLRTVTAGKIYVEIERARLTMILAKIKEDAGKVAEAADILQELQVETFGSMEKGEKVSFILEQMRLCLAKKDYICTQIISKKISTKYLEQGDSTVDLKLKFYHLMIELDENEGSYLAITCHYRAIYDTKKILDDPDKMKEVLKCVILYLILAPFNNEQFDLMQRVKEDKNLMQLPKYRELVKLFITPELIHWKGLCQGFEADVKIGSVACPATHVFKPDQEKAIKRWSDLKSRVVEHNIRVMAKYYVRVRIRRMSELLELSDAETEDFLSTLVVNGTVSAKIDRPAGIVRFVQHKDANDVLNDWAASLSQLMTLVNNTDHLINKEEMVHMLH